MPVSRFGNVNFIIDSGTPLVDGAVDGFLKIGTVAATRAAAEDAYHLAKRGSISTKDVEHSLKKMCREGAYWGSTAGLYVGMEYGVGKIRGAYDWKNATIAGALSGAIVSAMSSGNRDKIVMDALAGGAIATAAEFITHII